MSNEKILVCKHSLQSLLSAVYGPPHLIRELQSIMGLTLLPVNSKSNPVAVLLADLKKSDELPVPASVDERACLDELEFYRRHGYPYIDHANCEKTSRMEMNKIFSDLDSDRVLENASTEDDAGMYAMMLPAYWPSPGSEGTVMAVEIHAYTVPLLYKKAMGHIDSLGPCPEEHSL